MPKGPIKLSALSPTAFENLVFDLVIASGFTRVVWRTPGADGGRDIEAIYAFSDISQTYTSQKWYIECKHYRNSIDWATVYKKIAFADVHQADFFLLATNSNPSPGCETEVSAWNIQRRSTHIRFWRGYDFERLLSRFPAIAAKYGLLEQGAGMESSLLPLTQELMHLAQTAYVSHSLGVVSETALELGAAIAELVAQSMDSLRTHGRITSAPRATADPSFDWLTCTGSVSAFPETGLRAILAGCRHVTAAKSVRADFEGKSAKILVADYRINLKLAPLQALAEIAVWADLEISVQNETELILGCRD